MEPHNQKAYFPPVIVVALNNQPARGLVDTGCSITLIHSRMVSSSRGCSRVVAFDGRDVSCRGYADVKLNVGGHCLSVCAVVVDCLLP